MSFRDRLLATLAAMQEVLDVPDVIVAGSQVPNLLELDAASTLVVSQDVDLAVPVRRHADVKAALETVEGFIPSPEEPSVWIPDDPQRLEVNFIGMDRSITSPSETYVLEDDRLPLLVFGLLSHLEKGRTLTIGEVRIPLPRPAGLILEKLQTERTGIKGERDLLVALGVLRESAPEDQDELDAIFASLAPDQKNGVLANLTLLSLMTPLEAMPDPTAARAEIKALIVRLEAIR